MVLAVTVAVDVMRDALRLLVCHSFRFDCSVAPHLADDEERTESADSARNTRHLVRCLGETPRELQIAKLGERGATDVHPARQPLHTHLRGEALTRDDLTDLALLRLDAVAAITVDAAGHPGKLYIGHLLTDPLAPPDRR